MSGQVKKAMSKFSMLLRELAKENVLPWAYFDSPRSLYECCAASARHGVHFKMVPSRTILLQGHATPPRLLHASPIDPIQDYKIDPTTDITEYYLITAVKLDQSMAAATSLSGFHLRQNESLESLLQQKPRDFIDREIQIPHALAVEPWRVIGPLQPHVISLLQDARVKHADIVAEEEKRHRRRHAKLKNFFERLQKKSTRKLRFEDL